MVISQAWCLTTTSKVSPVPLSLDENHDVNLTHADAIRATVRPCSAHGGRRPPLVDYATYLGGSYGDTVAGIAVDSSGSAYIAGTTLSPDFPVTSTSLGTPSANSS